MPTKQLGKTKNLDKCSIKNPQSIRQRMNANHQQFIKEIEIQNLNHIMHSKNKKKNRTIRCKPTLNLKFDKF